MRSLLKPFLAIALLAGLATGVPTARAQDEVPIEGSEGGSTGDPLYGYVGTAFLASAAFFVLCKSARR